MLTGFERDHGGGVDAAVARYGGARIDWVDLSTGINPRPYPLPAIDPIAWSSLPDRKAQDRLLAAARRFWQVPPDVDILASSGASALIAGIPGLMAPETVAIPGPTYNEHAAAFTAQGWQVSTTDTVAAQVVVHPNNPDGRLWSAATLPAPGARLTVIDESFCDTCPEHSLMPMAGAPGTLILKSFGKFWGLAGLRLGFAVGDPALIARLRDALGPWPVSGPALEIGATALEDLGWAETTKLLLQQESERLDRVLTQAGARTLGGTSLFRLYHVDDALHWQDRLARAHIWTRVFPYNPQWLRLGLPGPGGWDRLEAALA